MTERDQRLLDFIDSYWEQFWTSPAYSQICEHMSWSSKETAHRHLHRLMALGLLEKKEQLDRRKSALYRVFRPPFRATYET